jgi:hypothetical protein
MIGNIGDGKFLSEAGTDVGNRLADEFLSLCVHEKSSFSVMPVL